MTKDKQKKSGKHGGARPGAGRKRKLERGEFTATYLDKPTRAFMKTIGEGELSEGIRRAGRIISRQFAEGDLRILIDEDKRIEEYDSKESE